MIPLLEKLLWRSDIGKQIQADALREIAAEEKALAAQARQHEKDRDAALQKLADEEARLLPEHEQAKADHAAAEEKMRRLFHRLNFTLPGDRSEAGRLHDQAVVPIRDRLKELATAKQQLEAHG